MLPSKCHNFFFLLLLVALFSVGSLTGCSYFKAGAAEKTTEFLGPDASKMVEQRERAPFHKLWVSKAFQEKRDTYNKVVIAPVDTSHLSEAGWWNRQTSKTKEDLAEDTQMLGKYVHDTFVKAVQEDPKHRFQIVSTPGPNTLVLEMALTEIIPSKAWMNAASGVAGFIVPGAGLLSSAGKGSVALEGKMVDGETGQVVAMMADREEDKSAVILDLAKMQFYAGAEEAIDDWAEQIVAMANTPVNEKVADSSPFKLFDW